MGLFLRPFRKIGTVLKWALITAAIVKLWAFLRKKKINMPGLMVLLACVTFVAWFDVNWIFTAAGSALLYLLAFLAAERCRLDLSVWKKIAREESETKQGSWLSGWTSLFRRGQKNSGGGCKDQEGKRRIKPFL